ncbi:putative odorant receptor 92a [Microplitis mediator]|uniref:putative odorant receptor 92a n=1 Tax=Microplitis mediator TaxID=375433 RepID=UPI0025540E2E|nr:putative odorant receptor 92a [Microplitis mediator]XP_057321351.1 putative odorant receptor 92a [Microplitis mediator]
MTVLEDSIFLYTCVGLWRPDTWTGLKANLYNFYTFCVLFINGSFFISIITDVDLNHFDFLGSMDFITLILQVVENIPKMLCVINNRNIVLEVLEYFQSNLLDPKNDNEKLIHRKFDNLSRRANLWLTVTGFTSITWYNYNHIMQMEPLTVLPYGGKIPYNYSSNRKIYLLTAVNQIYSVFSLASINAAFNTLFITMMLQISAKLNVLEYRFKIMLKKLECDKNNNSQKFGERIFYEMKSNLIGNWVENHIKLINLFDSVNSVFSKAIYVHYILNSFLLCTIAYIFSHTPFGDMISISYLIYFTVKCTQQYLQCVSAHQVTIEAENLRDTIFDTNWYNTKTAVQKSIIIIMSKTIIPVVFISEYFVELSIDSFKKVMKLSYTIYNVLE